MDTNDPYIHSSLQLRDTIPNKIIVRPLSSHQKQCRICMSSIQSPYNPFISPCECIGSVKYVHQECLKEWLSVKTIRDMENENGVGNNQGITCELCKRQISVQLQVNRQCNSLEEIKKRFSKKKALFIICLMGIMFSIALLGYSCIQLSNQIKKGYRNIQIVEKTVVVSSIILNCLLASFFAYHTSYFFINKKAAIKLINLQ